MAEVYEV